MADDSSATSNLTFKIGDVFSATDPVARYLTGVAMIANDWGRLFRMMEELSDRDPGARLLLYRLQLSFHLEATEFVRVSLGRFRHEIERFLQTLPAEARSIHAELVDEDGLARTRATEVRNLAFHYPLLHREGFNAGEEDMANLLVAAQDLEGSIEASPAPDFLEYAFADEVTLQQLPQNENHELDQDAIVAFRTRALSFMRFAELAIQQYVDAQLTDETSVESDLGRDDDDDDAGPESLDAGGGGPASSS